MTQLRSKRIAALISILVIMIAAAGCSSSRNNEDVVVPDDSNSEEILTEEDAAGIVNEETRTGTESDDISSEVDQYEADAADTGSEETQAGADTGDIGSEEIPPKVVIDTKEYEAPNAYAAYYYILSEKSEEIRAYWWQRDVEYESHELGTVLEDPQNKCVAFHDLDGDGVPELMFMSYEESYMALLHIYTYKNEVARECVCTNPEDLLGYEGILDDNHVGGGISYMLYSGREAGTFYIATGEYNGYYWSIIRKYKMDGTTLTKTRSVKNRYESYGIPDSDEWITIDDYTINDEAVSSSAGAAEFGRMGVEYDKLIMLSGSVGGMSVFEHAKTDTPLAMTYNEAAEYALNNSAR